MGIHRGEETIGALKHTHAALSKKPHHAHTRVVGAAGMHANTHQVCLEVIAPLTRFVCAHRDHAHRAGNAKTFKFVCGILLLFNICCAPPWGVPTRPKSAPKSRRLRRRSMDQYMSLVSATTPTRPPVRANSTMHTHGCTQWCAR